MATDKLPGWVTYVISALAAMVIGSVSLNGTLIFQDRNEIIKAVGEIKSMVVKQTEFNTSQKEVLQHICFALTLNHADRLEHLKYYPFTWSDKVK